ncbi:response regulator [Trichlorobacter lovleyi]|uniref:ATP-binding response regulator n=1 Tax=Trichlorobacter lovleyi TaxID=313985 RepID=UPI00223F6E0F|nr:ATP-binding protein [Trichlorobacter lovleyi]QOX78971.1 response regulator [Trichlorobacter lovleyi]
MRRALIADDHSDNLYFLEVLLKGNGFDTVDTAENGGQALEMARKNRPDLVISDILMPVMDGYALCRELKADPYLKEVPFIFYTATFTTAKDEALALSLGADRFIFKPQEPDTLIQTIRQVLSESRPVVDIPAAEKTILKEYNEALFRKLEKKMADLEQANRDLQQREQELLAAREAADCANRAKMRFLRTMSHELRTPLNIILGALQLSELDQAYDARMTAEAKTALFSMLDMIDNILEASRLESPGANFVQEPLQLEQLATTVSRLFSNAAQSKGLALRLSLADDLQRRIVADGVHLQQILVHLVSNAIKFTEHGSVEVRLKQETGTSADQPLLKIEVQDTGIGIEPDQQQRIFDLFTQLDDSDSRPYGGIGLGLTLTKRLVELMGGTINLQSSVGAGTTITVRLPMAQLP